MNGEVVRTGKTKEGGKVKEGKNERKGEREDGSLGGIIESERKAGGRRRKRLTDFLSLSSSHL